MSTNDKKNAKQKKEIPTPEVETVNDDTTQEVPEVEPTVEVEVITEPVQTAEEKLTQALKEEKDRNLRLMAEFDNFRRRSVKEKDSIYPDAVVATIKQLLPVLNNFKLALETPCADAEYVKGIQMNYTVFLESLTKLGLEEFGEVGETFDPNRHEAVMHCEDDSLGQNVIAQVFVCGYKIGDRIIRYATVKTAN